MFFCRNLIHRLIIIPRVPIELRVQGILIAEEIFTTVLLIFEKMLTR